MRSLKSLITENNLAGKTFISVDIQQEYQEYLRFKPYQFCSFINENFDSFNDVIFLYNGHETLGMCTEDEYKGWLIENELNEELLDQIAFYDKGYAFFRFCMDSGTDEDAIVNFVRFMYQNGITDSREMTREMWAKYLRQYRKIDKKSVYDLLKHTNDMLNIPDLMDFLKSKNNIVLTGGGINECLKEVEIALKSLNKNYSIFSKYTY